MKIHHKTTTQVCLERIIVLLLATRTYNGNPIFARLSRHAFALTDEHTSTLLEEYRLATQQHQLFMYIFREKGGRQDCIAFRVCDSLNWSMADD